MIRTLIVDDSETYRATLRSVLTPEAGFEIVGEAGDGAEALSRAVRARPTLVVMDVVMPGMDGLTATRRLMSEAPCAVVVISSGPQEDHQGLVFEALRAGAVEVLAKPSGLNDPAVRARFCGTLRSMASIKVVRRRTPAEAAPKLVVIGASTGGPPALEVLVRGLPPDFPLPIVVAQHLANGFAVGLQRWLQQTTRLPVQVVDRRLALKRGVYLADDGHHIEIDGSAVTPVRGEAGGLTPSVDRLFASARSYRGGVIALLLTGMGTDGAQGLLDLRGVGAATIAQDEASSLVFGMPRAAIERNAAAEVLPLQGLARRVIELAGASS
jgi:two-component system chemotaxis response regulator CheB